MNGDVQDVHGHDACGEPGGTAWHRICRKTSHLPGWVWAIPCSALAGLFAVVWPSSESRSDFTSLTYLSLRWGHSATWALLALSFLVRGSKRAGNTRIANVLAVSGLAIYVLFLFTAVLGTRL